MKKLYTLTTKMHRDEKGATVIEYALIAALISVAAIVAFSALGTKVGTTVNAISDKMVVPS